MMPAEPGIMEGRLLAVLPPRLAYAVLTFMMWAVMMVAMMLPSASPMVLTYARVVRGCSENRAAALAAFAGAYIMIWTAFSAAATAAQLALEDASLLYGPTRPTPVVGAVLLMLAGVYQLTPLKTACLLRCRSPVGFFMTDWRDGAAGALIMGLKHGAYCVGCCWMLMALLFVFGVMNLLWIAALSALVLLEKIMPSGRFIARTSGILMLIGAIALAGYSGVWNS